MENKTIILKALKKLKNQALSGQIGVKNSGICLNLEQLVFSDCHKILNGVSLVANLGRGWPDSSADPLYPIEGPIKYYSNSARCTRWRGIYLEKRLSLIDYLIVQVESASENELEHYITTFSAKDLIEINS